MKLTSKDVEDLRTILRVCKVLEIESVVIYEGLARGTKAGSYDSAIISEHGLSIKPELKLGIGNVSDLDKRFAIFNEADVDLKVRDGTEDISLLSIVKGRSKMQFRATSVGMIKYPKENIDEPIAEITFTPEEVTQISAAVKTLKSTHVTVQGTKSNAARLECIDANNDKFEIELSAEVKYLGEETSFVFNYLSGMFTNVLDNVARESKDVNLIIGGSGSITAKLKGHTIFVMAQLTGDEEDDDY